MSQDDKKWFSLNSIHKTVLRTQFLAFSNLSMIVLKIDNQFRSKGVRSVHCHLNFSQNVLGWQNHKSWKKPLIFYFFLTFKSSNLLYYQIVAYYVEQMALDKEFEAQKCWKTQMSQDDVMARHKGSQNFWKAQWLNKSMFIMPSYA